MIIYRYRLARPGVKKWVLVGEGGGKKGGGIPHLNVYNMYGYRYLYKGTLKDISP